MPHYHYNVHRSVIARDEGGLELPDLASAKASTVASERFLVIEEMWRDNRFSRTIRLRLPTRLA